ncbi:MAG: TRAP transporter large permease [Bacillota bacterium]
MNVLTGLGIFLLIFIALAFLRVPLGFSMGFSAIIILSIFGFQATMAAPVAFASLDTFPFLAIPFFIFAGDLMRQGGISRSLLDFTHSLVGRMRGSLGATAVIASMLFGTVTGSSLATVSTIGSIMIPEMEKAGYKRNYATALVSASGFLGILIPPSVPGIMYAISAGQPIDAVWLATVLPGIAVGILFILVNYFAYGRKEKLPEKSLSFGQYMENVGRHTSKAIPAIIMPLIIFYGVYGGVFTPTEAGVVAVVYGAVVLLVVSMIRRKGGQLKLLGGVLREGALTNSAICITIPFAMLAGRMVTLMGIPAKLSGFITDYTSSPVIFLLGVNILFLILGTFLETNTAILIMSPILVPVAINFGINPIQFGAVMLLNLELGMITPPVAANLFVGCRIGNVTIDQVLRPLMPFFLVVLPVLAVTTYVPAFSLWIPSLFK